jgi:hypothetical protein
MPWYGARLGQSSFLCIIETPDDVQYGVIANDVRAPEQPAAPASAVPAATTALNSPRLSAVWPYWHTVKGELGYARVANYIFQPYSGYVEMCKTYRVYAERIGKVVTLKQKIAANPRVEKLIGAPNFEIQVVASRARSRGRAETHGRHCRRQGRGIPGRPLGQLQELRPERAEL